MRCLVFLCRSHTTWLTACRELRKITNPGLQIRFAVDWNVAIQRLPHQLDDPGRLGLEFGLLGALPIAANAERFRWIIASLSARRASPLLESDSVPADQAPRVCPVFSWLISLLTLFSGLGGTLLVCA